MKQTCLLTFLFLAFTTIIYSQNEEKFSRNKLDEFYGYIDKHFDKKIINSNQIIPIVFYVDDLGKSFDVTFSKENDTLITNELKNIFDKMPYWDMTDQKNKFVIKITVNLFLNKDEKIKGTTKMSWYTKETFVKQNESDFKYAYNDSKANNSDNEILNLTGVEFKPEYPGGIQEFYSFVGKNFITPKSKEFSGGKLIAQFVIEKDGSLTDIKILKNPGFDTDKEAIRVLKRSPLWKPAEQKGRKVRCQFVLPIVIQSN